MQKYAVDNKLSETDRIVQKLHMGYLFFFSIFRLIDSNSTGFAQAGGSPVEACCAETD
jgi:hypothetical protein